MRTEKDSKENETLYKNYIKTPRFVLLFISISCFTFPKLIGMNTGVYKKFKTDSAFFLGGAL